MATFGLVNAWGVSDFSVNKSRKLIFALQVFQAYYTTTILKGTSPSTM